MNSWPKVLQQSLSVSLAKATFFSDIEVTIRREHLI
jgi:hypothetical protein